MKKTETERKFLVAGPMFVHQIILRFGPNQAAFTARWSIKQGYIHTTDPTVRVRHAVNDNGFEEAFLNLKDPGLLSRPEREVALSPLAALELLEDCRHSLQKLRYVVPFKGKTWEVDIFSGRLEGLVMAEIELNSEDEAFEKPEWVTKEVTFDKRYSNVNLAQFGIPKDDE